MSNPRHSRRELRQKRRRLRTSDGAVGQAAPVVEGRILHADQEAGLLNIQEAKRCQQVTPFRRASCAGRAGSGQREYGGIRLEPVRDRGLVVTGLHAQPLRARSRSRRLERRERGGDRGRLQILGQPWSQPTLIRIGCAYEQATRRRRSPASTPPLSGAP